MDKIYLHKCAFYGYHGLFSEETKLGQRFYVDLELELDLEQAGKSDEMTDSIDYGAVYQSVKEIVEGKPYKLIEAVAESIATKLLAGFPKLLACRVKVDKPDPPIRGHYQGVSVEVYRGRVQ